MQPLLPRRVVTADAREPVGIRHYALPDPRDDEAMNEVVLGSEDAGRFTLTDAVRGDDGEIWSVLATIEVSGVHAEKRVPTHYATHFDELIAYIADLADCWQGWRGTKSYVSLERDLGIDAVHDGTAHVRLTVTMKGPTLPERWTTTATVITDPGAQMLEAAESARALLGART
jgi:hypothetical protein